MPEKKDPTHYSELDPKSMNVSMLNMETKFFYHYNSDAFKSNVLINTGERVTSRTGSS